MVTTQGERLRGDVPGSTRALLDAETAPGHWLPWSYLLKRIVHDWDDESVRILLSDVSRAMAPGVTVAVVELLIPEVGTPLPASLMDINVLVTLPGNERLLAAAGLALTRSYRLRPS